VLSTQLLGHPKRQHGKSKRNRAMASEKIIELNTSGPMRLSIYGRGRVALSMYVKGKNFLAAAILLRQHGGPVANEYVALHLICQGVEIVLKGLLLFRNYEKYKTMLRKPLGHNLKKLVKTATTEFRVRPLSAKHMQEIEQLSNLYSNHILRYGNGYDILVNSSTIPSELTLRKITAIIRLSERHIKNEIH